MSAANSQDRLQLPSSLKAQLQAYKRRVWQVKLVEAGCIAVFGLFLAYLTVFILDRMWDTPSALRGLILVVSAVVAGCIPYALYRWVWRHRRLEQLARLLSRRMPLLGDQLLGVIELVQNDGEAARSRALCEAAVRQTAADAQQCDFERGLPKPRHRLWSRLAAAPVILAFGLLIVCGAAASNTWARFLAPWQDRPRYTFTMVDRLPDKYYVPHGESLTVKLSLLADSRWKPAEGRLQLGQQPPIVAPLREEGYEFELPPQLDQTWLHLRVGDATQNVRVIPMLRPELTSLTATCTLPQYLERSGQPNGQQKKDGRGGAISVVKGSRVTFLATASRDLTSARINGQPVTTRNSTIVTDEILVSETSKVEFRWEDEFGLAGKDPFVLGVAAREDDAPLVACQDLPRHRVLLETEQLAFTIKAQDDYGIRRVGIEWDGLDQSGMPTKYHGERVLGAGGPGKESLELRGTFGPAALRIEPQPIRVRVFAEDYLPGRPRSYSLPCTFYVLTAEEHAIWLTEQLNQWHRRSLEVRDREMRLHETNKQMRELTAKDLDRPENRLQLEQQAQAERANGRRLSSLVGSGEDLVRQAMRNPEFGVGHLEKWAEMLQILKDIAGNRMPSVADLLKQGAQAPVVASNSAAKPSKSAGQNRLPPAGGKGSNTENKTPPKPVPSITDVESSQAALKKSPETPEDPAKKKSSGGRLTLPQTMVAADGKQKPKSPESPTEQKVDEAIAKQQDLLAEFDKITDELNRVLANLEGSTLVKRLKAASRVQYRIGGKISEQVAGAFGLSANNIAEPNNQAFRDLSKQETKATQDVSFIMDDLQAYTERRQMARFQTVLEEMRKEDVIGGLRQLGDDLKKEAGLSIAQSEFWSDTLDRWADNLVDPACAGKCCGCKSKGSLPPSIVLEVLQILEVEVNLREETRVTQQSKAAVSQQQYSGNASRLSAAQEKLQKRVETVNLKISQLPDASSDFGKRWRC